MADWYFPPNSGGETHGLNEPGVEMFKETDSLARETVQNVLDNPDGSGRPRVVEFELLDLPFNLFPGLDSFRRTFQACKEYMEEAGRGGSGGEEAFFQRGEELLTAETGTIPTLRVRDLHTTGLEGEDHEEHLPFCRLLRVQGISSGQGPRGGTYGIGQRAPFHCSALRAVLYYTRRARDGGEAFTAKSILSTHRASDPPHRRRQAKGWWCISDPDDPDAWKALRDPMAIPESFRREEPGTDLYVTGFVLYEQWHLTIRNAILKNFFAAIDRGQLEVRIKERGGTLYDITAHTLEQILHEAADEQRAVDAETAMEELDATVGYLAALRQPANGEPFRRAIRSIGNVEFYAYRNPQNPNLPDHWAYMRRPLMLVGTREARVIRRFAGVLICDNEGGNQYLSRLEGPQHREWKPSEWRNATPAELRDAQRVERDLRNFVRESLRSLRAGADTSTLNPPMLGNYLPMSEEPVDGFDSTPGTGVEAPGAPVSSELGDRGLPEVRPQTIRRREPREVPPALEVAEELPAGGPGAPGPLGGDETSEGGTEGRGGEGNSGTDGPGTGEELPLISRRQVTSRSYTQGSRCILVLTARADVSGDLRLVAYGESGPPQSVRIIEAFDTAGEQIPVAGARIRGIRMARGDTLKLSLNLDVGSRVCLAVGG